MPCKAPVTQAFVRAPQTFASVAQVAPPQTFASVAQVAPAQTFAAVPQFAPATAASAVLVSDAQPAMAVISMPCPGGSAQSQKASQASADDLNKEIQILKKLLQERAKQSPQQ